MSCVFYVVNIDVNPSVVRHKELTSTYGTWHWVVVWHHANVMCCVFCTQCGLCHDVRNTWTLWAPHLSFQLSGHWSERHSKYAVVVRGWNMVSCPLGQTIYCMWKSGTTRSVLCSLLFSGLLLLANCHLPHQVSQPTHNILEIRKSRWKQIKLDTVLF